MTAPALDVRPEARTFRGGRLAMRGGLVAGAAGTALLAIGFAIDPRQALFSYLIAYAYLLALALGAMAFVLSVHAANSVWPTAVRRLAEAGMAVLPLMAVLLVPVLVGAGWLYPWTHAETVPAAAGREVVLERRWYLNLPFVCVRAAVIFAFLVGTSGLLRRWSRRMDHEGDAAVQEGLRTRLRVLSGVALPAYGILATIGAWDWLMSLSPDWYSTMFGLNYLAGGFVAALAAVALTTVLARRAGYLAGIGPSHHYALGRLMFAFLIFWAYTSYFQYFLSWIANRPVEARWFQARSRGGYGAIGLFLVFGHFGLPFLVLLTYWIKQRAWGIAAVAVWLLGSHYFAIHWIVAAARERPNPFSWMDAAALLCVGGFSLAFAVARQRGVPLAPVADPYYARALEYESA
jgi:hypothetical protein